MNDIDATAVAKPLRVTLARCRTYALLAQGFRYPDERTFSHLADGSFSEELLAAIEGCGPELRGALNSAPELSIGCSSDELQSAYLSAFETGMPDPSASLYEGSHANRENRPGLLLELKGFYGNFGLQMAAAANDLEDTLTAELEFMQFLTAKQLQAESDGLEPRDYLWAQRDFLMRHLAVWLPRLETEIAAKVKEPFYLALAKLAAVFVAHESEVVRIASEQFNI
ncbi:molecular chaperone TorD family protein [Denitromonas sp.]|uniref:molecular chaperone TorD family protein n=1 Tax=Denitromonas sp. TaxID=2734609 RepID=UPI002AFE6ADD|nr:molecular chaperone TorD family protein [Denitromonas sp.]